MARADSHSKAQTVKGETDEPSGDSKTLKYAKKIISPDEHEERNGQTLVTRNHDVIRQWAEEREASPASIEGSEHDGHLGVLRMNFPGYAEGGNLVEVPWEDWFAAFDARKLNFIYQETHTDGSTSNFFRLDNPERDDG